MFVEWPVAANCQFKSEVQNLIPCTLFECENFIAAFMHGAGSLLRTAYSCRSGCVQEIYLTDRVLD